MARPRRASGRVLVVSGLDPTGRAGLVADVLTVRQQGLEPLAVASVLTAQGTAPYQARPVSAPMFTAQLRAALAQGPQAVKLGAIPNRRLWRALWGALEGASAPVVVDPVVRTSKGEPLSSLTPPDFRRVARLNVVLTPNLLEARWLTGASRADGSTLAPRLGAWGFGAVVVKGGHLQGAPVDWVWTPEGTYALRGRRRARSEGHRGTGCRFASALAAGLAKGGSLRQAAAEAKAAVQFFLRTPIVPALF